MAAEVHNLFSCIKINLRTKKRVSLLSCYTGSGAASAPYLLLSLTNEQWGMTSQNFESEHTRCRVWVFGENHEKAHPEQVPGLFYVTANKDIISSINMMLKSFLIGDVLEKN